MFERCGRSFAEAIGENPTAGLTLGTFAALVVAMVLYIPRGLMSLQVFMTGVIDGIKTMIPVALIFIFMQKYIVSGMTSGAVKG